MRLWRYSQSQTPETSRLRSASVAAVALIAIVLVSIAVFQVAVAARPQPAEIARAKLESRLDKLAGAQAQRCGDQTRHEPIHLGCARAALAAHRPFRMVRVHQGIDDAITIGYAGDHEGRLWEISYPRFASWPGSGIDTIPLYERRCWFPGEADFYLPCK